VIKLPQVNTNVCSSGADARPRLSIVLATWQAASSLDACLRSTVEQSFVDWELLVVDGASTDGTVDVIRRFEDHIAWWHSEKDDGIYDAWNKGLAHARGEYVCFIGADDKWADAASLSRLFDAIGKNEYDLVTSQGNSYNSTTDKSFRFGSAWDFKRIGPRTIICHPGLLPSLIIGMDGVSRQNVGKRLKEQREVLSRCKRYGPLRAYVNWVGKWVRIPIARLLGASY